MDILQDCPLFAGLSAKEIETRLHRWDAKRQTYGKNEFLHRAGEPFSRFGLVLAGRVEVLMDDIHGDRWIMANVTPGTTFGEAHCFLQTPEPPVWALAAEDTEVLWLRPTAEERTPAALLMAKRMLAMNDRIQILSQRTLRQKLIAFLTQCRNRAGGDTFEIPFTREPLAAYLAADRSALSRELSRMEADGLLHRAGKKFQILP